MTISWPTLRHVVTVPWSVRCHRYSVNFVTLFFFLPTRRVPNRIPYFKATDRPNDDGMANPTKRIGVGDSTAAASGEMKWFDWGKSNQNPIYSRSEQAQGEKDFLRKWDKGPCALGGGTGLSPLLNTRGWWRWRRKNRRRSSNRRESGWRPIRVWDW